LEISKKQRIATSSNSDYKAKGRGSQGPNPKEAFVFP
jgi:hypothetical protein